MEKNSCCESGFSLLEVLAALGLLVLLTGCVLGTFSASGLWISEAGERTKARDYASSIIETIRAHSVELSAMDLMNQASFEANDEDTTDGFFSFSLDPEQEAIVVPAPEDLKASLVIRLHDCSAYYKHNQEVLLENNLFEVYVKIETKKPVEMFTVIAAR